MEIKFSRDFCERYIHIELKQFAEDHEYMITFLPTSNMHLCVNFYRFVPYRECTIIIDFDKFELCEEAFEKIKEYVINQLEVEADIDMSPKESRHNVIMDLTYMIPNLSNNEVVPDIKNVIFNDPATIVFWEDGTKTVVKTQASFDPFDKEKGLAMAIAKKALGNTGRYYETFKKWL